MRFFLNKAKGNCKRCQYLIGENKFIDKNRAFIESAFNLISVLDIIGYVLCST